MTHSFPYTTLCRSDIVGPSIPRIGRWRFIRDDADPQPRHKVLRCLRRRISVRVLIVRQDRVVEISESRRIDVAQHHLTARSEEHTSELQSLMRISYAVFCLQ